MWNSFGTYLLRAFFWPLSRLPLKVHYGISPAIAFLVGKVFRYRRDTVVYNMSRAFPEMTCWEIADRVNAFYRHFADVVVEAIWFGGCSQKRLRKEHIAEIVNPEEVERLFNVSPSVMVLCSHAGNWEISGGLESYNYTGRNFPLSADNIRITYREMSSKAWDGFFRRNRMRPSSEGVHYKGYIESKEVVRYVMRHASEKLAYHFITDQRPYYSNSGNMKVTFMGLECTTMSAGAALAHKMGMSVCYLNMSATRRGLYTYSYKTICEDASRMSVEDIMGKYYQLLEEEICLHPFNYLWTHRRWC